VKLASIRGKEKGYLKSKIDEFETNRKIKQNPRIV
jgi:hypothetical protein